jgi:hypothetical protein
MEAFKPKYRFKLKGAIIACGYKSLTQFARDIGYGQSQLSNIINGWLFPSPEWQRKAAQALGITISELKDLL